MNCLVTGGAGFVGTNLIKRLLKEGHNVVSLDNYSSGLKENEVEGCKYYDVDLCEVEDYSFFMDKPDTIFHMAALARIQTSLREPQYHIKNNFVSTLNVLEFARQKECPVVYAGSSSKHHGVTGSPYAWVKWSGEELCKLYSDVYDVPTSICRFYNVYGPHQLIDGQYCTVVGIFQEQYKKGEPLTITGDGEQRRDFTHVDDIVDGLIIVSNRLTLFKGGHIAGEEFELGRGKNYSINEIVNAFGEEYPRKHIGELPGEMRETLCTDTKAREEIGWKPTRDVIKYIKETK